MERDICKLLMCNSSSLLATLHVIDSLCYIIVIRFWLQIYFLIL
jgi:hypothetical protein